MAFQLHEQKHVTKHTVYHEISGTLAKEQWIQVLNLQENPTNDEFLNKREKMTSKGECKWPRLGDLFP